MPTLRELQSEFLRCLFAPAGAPTPSAFRTDRRAPERGFAAYRNTAYANLRAALRGIYPVVERLVGEGFFARAADSYISESPSTSGDLNRYGASFPDFLARFAPARPLAYLADVAALEWVRHLVGDVAESEPATVHRLATIAPQDYGRLVCRLQPAARLLRSGFPVLEIWQKNQPQYTGEMTVSLGQGGDHLLIRRLGPGVRMERLTATDWELLHLLAQGTPLETVLDRLAGVDPGFDLAAALQRHIVAGVIVDILLPPANMQE